MPIKKNLREILHKDILVSLVFYAVILLLSFLFQRLYNNAQQAYTNLRQTQEQLLKTEKMAAIGQMAAAISHDLRNPLTGIKMAIYYLGSKIDKGDADLNNIIKDIEMEIDYASNVVSNVLTYSRPTELIYSHNDINKIIEDTLHFVYLQNRNLNVEIVKDFDANIPELYLDNKQIKQAMVNFLLNAMQAMPTGGRLTLRTRLVEDSAELTIEDTGSGIDADNLEKIFTPFFTTKARGVGLGLSIANNIIKKHGGRIEVSSSSSAGTVFKIFLPLTTNAQGKQVFL